MLLGNWGCVEPLLRLREALEALVDGAGIPGYLDGASQLIMRHISSKVIAYILLGL